MWFVIDLKNLGEVSLRGILPFKNFPGEKKLINAIKIKIFCLINVESDDFNWNWGLVIIESFYMLQIKEMA